MIICKQIRKVNGGYILELRWPYGSEVMGHGEAICATWDEAIGLLSRAAGIPKADPPPPGPCDNCGTPMKEGVAVVQLGETRQQVCLGCRPKMEHAGWRLYAQTPANWR